MNQIDRDTAERYLLNEMSEKEREQFEDSFLADESLFYTIVERENELVDRYAQGQLSETVRERFERSLDSHPARRQKIANAKMLREFIDSERTEDKTITLAERSGFFSRVAELFSFRSPAFQFASIGLIAILGVASVLLLIENRRLGSLQSKLAESKQRESELISQIENERGNAEALTAGLNAERERREKLEAEIAKLEEGRNSASPKEPPIRPTIATLVLPFVTSRGGPSLPSRRLELAAGVTRVSIVVELPPDGPAVERASVRINDKTIAALRVRERRMVFGVDRSLLKTGRNSLIVSTTDGVVIGEYSFTVVSAE
jgi:hypothetical protein